MYSIIKYKDIIYKQDEATIKRYELIRMLSKDFTVSHNKALELDKLLTEQMDIETDNPLPGKDPDADRGPQQDRPATIHPSATRKKQQQVQPALEIEMQFRELFDALKDQQPRYIRYELPRITTVEMEKPAIESFQQMVDDLILGSNIFFVGGAGTGKTYLAELLAHKALGREHLTINCSQWTSPTEIIGGQSMDGYVEGKLIEAWQNGYVLILDELPKIDPNTAGLFNDALAKSKIPNGVIFNARKESFTKHPDFACIATGNIYPNKESMAYGANNKQDLSLLDRFSGCVYYIEKNPRIERSILQNDLVWSICDKLRNAVEELKYEAQLSLRFMLNARDAYKLEMQRYKDNGRSGVQANEGKTLKSAVDNYLSTFTEVQGQNLKAKIKYSDLLERYQYRTLAITKTA